MGKEGIKSRKVKVLSVFGTRPEAIKMAPVVKALDESADFESVVAVTAQHREMLDQVLQLFSIRPQYDFNVMMPRQTLGGIVTRCLPALEETIAAERPDLVLAQGDTTTAFVAGLAAFYQRVPIGHVEAGLRTNEKYEPYPEEMNRRLLSVLADLHFAPTSLSRGNLLKENTPAERIFVTGNTVIDAVRSVARDGYQFGVPQLERIDFDRFRVILATAHRRENWGEPLESIALALRDLVAAHPDVLIVFPVHKNPVVSETVHAVLGDTQRVVLCDPLGYEDMANLLRRAYLVMTDSGGLQEEAPGFGRPVLVLRNVTERPEGVEAGTLRLVGTDRARVVAAASELLSDSDRYGQMARAANPYGDGRAAERILAAIRYHFRLVAERPEEFLTR